MCQAYIVMQCTHSIIMEQNAIGAMSQPQLVKTPTWLRVLQISIGAISIILSGYVLAQPGLAIFTVVQILSIVLLFVGIQSTAVGTFSRYIRTSSRFSNIALGASAIAFSILIMKLLPPPPILFSIFLGGFAILFNGIGGIMQGMGGHGISKWFRAPLIGVGVLSIAISGLIIAHPIGFGAPLLAVIMSFALLIIGIEIIAMGAVGRLIVGKMPTRKKS
jgi:uncharacterized membrane protein HdeD (DUF308 family)